MIVGVLATLSFLALPLSIWIDEFASVGHLITYELVWWTAVAAVLAYVAFIERRPLASLGFRRQSVGDLFISVMAAALILGGVRRGGATSRLSRSRYGAGVLR
jgi:hypothetical protein